MAISSYSTIPAVRSALQTAIGAALPAGVCCYRAWPGPDADREMVILGKTEGTHELPVMKAGRRQRQEEYTIDCEVWVFGGAGATPQNVDPVEDRAWELVEAVEDVLANNPQIDGTATILWAEIGSTEMDVAAFENSWAVRILLEINVSARLI